MTVTTPGSWCRRGLHRRASATNGVCGGCRRDEALDHTAMVLAGLLGSTAAADVVRAVVAAVAPTSDRASAVGDHFSQHPHALTSGASTGPLVALKVLNGLIAAEITGVNPPTCASCQRPQRHFVKNIDGGRQCCDCRQHVLREPCADCHQLRRVVARAERGPLCQTCWANDPASWRPCGLCATLTRKSGTMAGVAVGVCCYVEPAIRCTVCGLAKGVHAWKTRRPVCAACQHQPRDICAVCGRDAPIADTGSPVLCALCRHHPAQPCIGCQAPTPVRDRQHRPRCIDCYQRPEQPCGRCGAVRPIVRLATGDTPDLCGLCWRGPITTCHNCGRTAACRGQRRNEMLCAACAPRSREPCIRCQQTRPVAARLPTGSICAACYQTFLRARAVCPGCGDLRRLLEHPDHPTPVCSDCCHDRDRQICERCNTEDALPRVGRCTRCAINDILDDTLGAGDDRAVNGMQPVYDAITDITKLRSTYDWLTRQPAAADLLRRVATSNIARTHDAFDHLPDTRAVTLVEELLTVTGVLPPCDMQLVRLERSISRYIASIDNNEHRRVLHRHATWHILARARRQSPLSEPGRNSRLQRLRAAHRILTWLADRNSSLTECTQADLDALATNGPPGWKDTRTFIGWAQHHHLAPPDLEFPTRPTDVSPNLLDDDERWDLIRRLLHDDNYPIDVRVAGLLACLYAQPLTRILTLTTNDITPTADGITIRLGNTPINIPEPLARHIIELREREHHTSVAKITGDTRWLFPGHNPGRARTPTALAKKLRQHGIRVSDRRPAALAHLAATMPAVVVADLLGISIHTATRWAELTGRTWTDYIAHRHP